MSAVVKKEAANTSVAPITEEDKALLALYGNESYEDAIRVQSGAFPMLKVLQPLSPAVTDEGMRAGTLYHSIAKESFKPPVTIVPVFLADTYAIWNDRADGGGLIARSLDGRTWDKPHFEFTLKSRPGQSFKTGASVQASGLTEWKNGDKPVADRTIVLFCVLKDHPEYGPMRVFFRSSALKEGVTFSQQLQAKRNKIVGGSIKSLPPFAFQVDLNVVQEKNDKGSFFLPKMVNLRPLDVAGQDKEIAAGVKMLYDTSKEQFRSAALHEGEQETDEAAPPISSDY